MTTARELARAHYAAWNARDLDALSELQAEHISIVFAEGTLRGREAARQYALGVMNAFSGVQAQVHREVADTPTIAVTELRLVNPARGSDAPKEHQWHLGGLACEVIEVADGRICAITSSYVPDPSDRTAAGLIPARATAARMAEDQAALRRVARLVAAGARQDAVFAAVNREVASIVDADTTALLRFHDDAVILLAAQGAGTPELLPVGAARPVDDVLRRIRDTGRPARLRPDGSPQRPDVEETRRAAVRDALGVPIVVEAAVWGLAYAGRSGDVPFPPETEERIAEFTELVAAAIGGAEHRAQLAASRTRVLATADATRRRIQRDLHDGAQQRLVQATVVLELAERAIAEGSDSAGPLVREALDHTRQAAGDLHDLVRGIMPQALVRGGIHGGIRALVEEVALPVEVRADVPRTAPELETAVYFVVAEALTNTVKHAEATRASVDVALTDADVTVSVRDDGRGGARLGAGSGLVGLQDRVAALGGSLALDSSPGEGTHLSVVLPQPGSANGSR